MRNYHTYNEDNTPKVYICVKEVERITKERKPFEYKQRRASRQTKRWSV